MGDNGYAMDGVESNLSITSPTAALLKSAIIWKLLTNRNHHLALLLKLSNDTQTHTGEKVLKRVDKHDSAEMLERG